MHTKGSVSVACRHCGTTFNASPSEKRIYCSKACINKSAKEKFVAKFTTARKAMARRKLLTKCERCGYSETPEILGVHHKDRNRNNNLIDNLEVLCPNCHSLEHRRHIPHGVLHKHG
jgi:Zn finger protein HypA/HybF involved in hydrogenase expression